MGEEKNILITGVTGNLGGQLLKLLLTDRTKKTNLFLLVRAENKNHAKKRVSDLFQRVFPKHHKKFLNNKNIKILVGDITKEDFGLRLSDYISLAKNIDIIYHVAALTRFYDPISQLRKVNVIGTRRILDLVSGSHNQVDLHYISTAFVAGNCKGKFRESDFDVGQDFNNPYERSKFEAEGIVRKFSGNNRRVKIYRPSIVVGEYRSGVISEFQMFYQPLYLLTQEIFEEIPISNSTVLNLVPVDIAAKMIYTLSNHRASVDTNTYHIVSPNALKILEIINLAAKYFNFKQPRLAKKIKFKSTALGRLYEEPIKPFLKYFTFRARFQCQETINELKKLNFSPPVIDDRFLWRIFNYAVKRKYIYRNK